MKKYIDRDFNIYNAKYRNRLADSCLFQATFF